jgi:1-acyl-sn-glycerol-3-phosphate acyltransferase
MTFAQSIISILKAGAITAELMLLPPIETGGAHRRELAGAARSSIGTALGYPND